MSIRCGPYKNDPWPANDAGVKKMTPRATTLLNSTHPKPYEHCPGCHTRAEAVAKRSGAPKLSRGK